MNDNNNKQIAPWVFSDLEEMLETYADSPERLLLDAYKGLLSVIEDSHDSLLLKAIKKDLGPTLMILNSVYSDMLGRDLAQHCLDYPDHQKQIKK